MRYAIETFTFCDGFVNTWTDDDQNPVTFDTKLQAEIELHEFLSDSIEAFTRGEIDAPYLESDYRIVEVTK